MKNRTVAENFVNGDEDSKGSNLFIENNVLYSYGYHFPLAVRLKGDSGDYIFLVNIGKYSISTSKHQSYLRQALGNRIVFGNSTSLLKQVIDSRVTTLREALALKIGALGGNLI
jgi:hypothetical protein